MTPIGEQLRAAREQRGLTLERVADETNIAKRYLVALESEDFAIFPGDPYAMGFLRNYAEYLGLPSDDLVAAFKNLKIQEQPVPIQELIPKRGPSKTVVIAAAAGGAVLVAIVLVLLLSGGRRHAADATAIRHAPVEYRMEGAGLEKRLFMGDSILVNSGAEKYKLFVSRLDDAVTLDTPAGPTRLILGEEGTIDLDRNNQPELKVLVTDLAKKDSAKGAVLRFEYASAEAALRASKEAPVTDQAQASAQAAAAQAGAAPAARPAAGQAAPPPPQEALSAVGAKSVVLFESAKSPYPFVVSVTFRGACMFRYEVDRRDRDEHYYRKGETLSVNANNSVKLWASNGQAAKLTVQASGGKAADLDIGGAGEVAVKRILWSQADSGGWTLSAVEVD